MQLGVLVSGGLGLTVLKELIKKYTVGFVLTDKKSVGIKHWCTKNSIVFFAGNPRGKEVLQQLNYPQCDLIVSVNYLFIVNNDIIAYPAKMAINFHGSLLPKYRGRTPHVWAIINNEKETGITAHVIDAGCDTGDIIAQIKFPVEEHYTGQDVLSIYENCYPPFVLQTIADIENNNFILQPQDNGKATYFGKRTPEDGLIIWQWQKERIKNWVRAQAKPYPGAFSFIHQQKIVINKIEFSPAGFNYADEDGKILAIEQGCPVVKTPNGCVKLTEFEYTFPFTINEVLK